MKSCKYLTMKEVFINLSEYEQINLLNELLEISQIYRINVSIKDNFKKDFCKFLSKFYQNDILTEKFMNKAFIIYKILYKNSIGDWGMDFSVKDACYISTTTWDSNPNQFISQEHKDVFFQKTILENGDINLIYLNYLSGISSKNISFKELIEKDIDDITEILKSFGFI